MALPVEWEKRKEVPGFGAEGKYFPSVRLFTRKGSLVKSAKKNGLGCRLHAMEVTEEEVEMDKVQIRKAWRKWMTRTMSYNWTRKAEIWKSTLEKAKGEEGALAALMTARSPKYAWKVAEDDDAEDDDDEEEKGEDNASFLVFHLFSWFFASPALPPAPNGRDRTGNKGKRRHSSRG